MKYSDSIDLSRAGWKSDAIKLMEGKVHFVGVNYKDSMRGECIAFAQEYDFRVVEGPKAGQVGFVLRDSIKPLASN